MKFEAVVQLISSEDEKSEAPEAEPAVELESEPEVGITSLLLVFKNAAPIAPLDKKPNSRTSFAMMLWNDGPNITSVLHLRSQDPWIVNEYNGASAGESRLWLSQLREPFGTCFTKTSGSRSLAQKVSIVFCPAPKEAS